MATNGITYMDGDFTVVTPVSLPEMTAPIPGVNVNYILTQEFVQLEANFASLALNTAYPNAAGSSAGADFAGDDTLNAAGYILVEEGPLRDIGAGVVRWQRKYAILPQPHYDPVQVSYTFPGFMFEQIVGGIETLSIVRNPFTRSVPGVIEHRYFLAGTNTQAAIQSLETSNFVQAQLFLWPRDFDPPVPNEALQVDYLWQETSPSLGTYTSWIDNGTQTIVAQASQFDRWNGNIIHRQVITILPA